MRPAPDPYEVYEFILAEIFKTMGLPREMMEEMSKPTTMVDELKYRTRKQKWIDENSLKAR